MADELKKAERTAERQGFYGEKIRDLGGRKGLEGEQDKTEDEESILSAEDELRARESLKGGGEHFYKEDTKKVKARGKWIKALPAILVLLIVLIAAGAMTFLGGNLVPDAISERLIEATDVQYADAVKSKTIVFAEAMREGEVPDDTAESLKQSGYTLGYLDPGAGFVEDHKSGNELFLKSDSGDLISADEFYGKVSTDTGLYAAFTKATYGRAAYYYDEAADEVFEEIGVKRNDYTAESDFKETMNELVSEDNNMNIATTSSSSETNENGETKTTYTTTSTRIKVAEEAVNAVAAGTKNTTSAQATLDAAASLNTADTVAKKQKSEQFFVAIMENISKMKAGEGSDSQINAALNYMMNSTTSKVVDTDSGEEIETTGAMTEAPSLYALLSGTKVDENAAKDYSADRVLKTTENQVGATNGGGAISSTLASVANGIKATISRWLSSGTEAAISTALAPVVPTISSSLIGNTFETMENGGVAAGEFMAEGAVNTAGDLATYGSGASAGDTAATLSYLGLNEEVVAMDARVERESLNPFDISSKNTFLGAIVYKSALIFATSLHGSGGTWGTKVDKSELFAGILSGSVNSAAKIVASSVNSLLPEVFAEGEDDYLSTFGDCETLGESGAVGTAVCSKISSFDTSTLGNIYSDGGFADFLAENTKMNGDSREVIENSYLDYYIRFNNARTAPIGVIDTSILSSLISGSRATNFISDAAANAMVALDAVPEEYRKIATGEAFVNSSENSEWTKYKYAQRYVSLSRAVTTLRQYSSDETAYANLEYFEGRESPVMAVLREVKNESVAKSERSQN